ncbi:LOW QUALITY PROTEIN: hypothetical protein ENUP19_0165G0001 [Entamoeba nuttalli]|uniref:Uncharacterized protein n=1 Tax=Entamoeba nuttalli TaxID=412467 RepID=A0ABQ0DM21_9EUKA
MYLIPRYSFKFSVVNPPNEIKNNMNVPVKTINGEDQFNIIKYMILKCPHAKFTEAKGDFVEGDLSYLPLTKEYLNTPISITWENGESVSVNYKIYRERASVANINEKLKQGIIKPLTEEETKDIINTKKALNENDRITRNFISNDYNIHYTFCEWCKHIIRSFDTKDEKTYEETISNCIDLFDSNNYPIQVIFPKNG